MSLAQYRELGDILLIPCCTEDFIRIITYLETFYFGRVNILFCTEHRDGIPVFFSERISAVFDMVAGYPRRQETRIIDENNGYGESVCKMCQNISKISDIGRTRDYHPNIIFFDYFFDNFSSFSIDD